MTRLSGATTSPSTLPNLPDRITGLAAVARNLSWSWNRNARALFCMLDPALWRRTQHNPVALLRRVDPARLARCAAVSEFLSLYDAVVAAGEPRGIDPSQQLDGIVLRATPQRG